MGCNLASCPTCIEVDEQCCLIASDISLRKEAGSQMRERMAAEALGFWREGKRVSRSPRESGAGGGEEG